MKKELESVLANEDLHIVFITDSIRKYAGTAIIEMVLDSCLKYAGEHNQQKVMDFILLNTREVLKWTMK